MFSVDAKLPATCWVPELSPVSELLVIIVNISFSFSGVKGTGATINGTDFVNLAKNVS